MYKNWAKARHIKELEKAEGRKIEEKFECEPCGLTFLKSHEFELHKEDLNCKGLLCPLCGFGAEISIESRYREVAKHMKCCIPGKRKKSALVACDICGKEITQQCLKRHKKVMHGPDRTETPKGVRDRIAVKGLHYIRQFF